MSTEKSLSRDYVIIRAFEDEPVKLRVVGIRGDAIDAVGSDETLPMPFHAYRTYRFEERIFSGLRVAYEKHQMEKLNQLWERAELFQG